MQLLITVFFSFFYYTLMAQNPNFSQSGLASYYGKKFHGQKTASGEYFDMHSLTAAHKKLPFNTMVKVTNLRNNKTVIVRINDRGPYGHNRIIDLSREAAENIDMIKRGIVKVKIEVITPDTSKQEKAEYLTPKQELFSKLTRFKNTGTYTTTRRFNSGQEVLE